MRSRFPILHETLSDKNIGSRSITSINEDVYALLTAYLMKEDFARTVQPNMIVGGHGSGKTFLMKRLLDKVSEDMSNILRPVIMEGKSLFSTEDIWIQCASLLGTECGKDSFEYIINWQECNSRRIVLLIDNMQYYFNRTDKTEQYGLRGKLNRIGAPILIASSEKVLPAFTEYDAAFFEGFKINYLKPLTTPAILNLTNGLYDNVRIERIMSFMPKTVRSMLVAMEILEKSDDSEKDLVYLTDYFYSHYQEKFGNLPTQAQRIVLALMTTDTGFTLSEIRNATGQENGKISPYLKLMSDQKIIKKEAKTLRGGIYSIADPLFKLWLNANNALSFLPFKRH